MPSSLPQGLCDSSGSSDHSLFNRHLGNSIVMEHWGRPTGIKSDNPCWLFDTWPTGCDQVSSGARDKRGDGKCMPFRIRRQSRYSCPTILFITAPQIFQMVSGEKRKAKGISIPLPCYTKGKDLVVPTITSEEPDTSRCEEGLARMEEGQGG